MALLTPHGVSGNYDTNIAESSISEASDDSGDVYKQPLNPEQLEVINLIEQEFGENHELLTKVARCESHWYQHKPDGSLLYNWEGSSAVGVFQIMESIHREKALGLGYDVRTIEGNIGFAKYLFEKDGIGHWNASKDCWSN